MYYVYILLSEKDKQFYTGYTKNLERRVEEHQNGKVYSIYNRLPVRLVYYEASLNQSDTLHREKYLKTTYGKRYIRNRLKNYLNE